MIFTAGVNCWCSASCQLALWPFQLWLQTDSLRYKQLSQIYNEWGL